MGSGGPGSSRLPGERRDDIAYGSRPSVPERLLTEGGRSFESMRQPHLPSPGFQHELDAFTYGPDPRLALAAYDPLLSQSGDALPRTLARRGQMIPPVPAPQEVCIVNAFDPSWGTPPSTVQGLALPFDPGLGAYRFDASYSLAHGNVDGLLARQAYRLFGERWKQGLMLQPYRQEAGGRWRFRWIPRVRNVVCGDAGSDLVQATDPFAGQGPTLFDQAESPTSEPNPYFAS